MGKIDEIDPNVGQVLSEVWLADQSSLRHFINHPPRRRLVVILSKHSSISNGTKHELYRLELMEVATQTSNPFSGQLEEVFPLTKEEKEAIQSLG